MKYGLLLLGIVWFILGWTVDNAAMEELRAADTVTPEHLYVVFRALHGKIAAYICWAAYVLMEHHERWAKKGER